MSINLAIVKIEGKEDILIVYDGEDAHQRYEEKYCPSSLDGLKHSLDKRKTGSSILSSGTRLGDSLLTGGSYKSFECTSEIWSEVETMSLEQAVKSTSSE